MKEGRLLGAAEARREALSRLLAADAAAELESYLLANSGLPGPRGNLELAHALADQLSGQPPGPAVRSRLEAWRALSAEAAPTGDPREYLCFCGTLAWSSDWVRGSVAKGRATIIRNLRAAAGDPRWRRREAVAMALQRIGETDPAALLALLAPWLEKGGFLVLRAVAAALAHPPLLGDAAFARRALALADRILARTAAAPSSERKQEDFRVLRQGLGYALSVLAAAQPQAGFALLERWAGARDPDVAWILRENLKKKRLQRWPERTRRLSAKLGGS
jgi:hypothetical protein